MDKDSVILKFHQNTLKSVSKEVDELSFDNSTQEDEIEKLKNEIFQLREEMGLPNIMVSHNGLDAEELNDYSVQIQNDAYSQASYDNLYETAASSLRREGLDLEQIDYKSLVSDDELVEIEKQLNINIANREKWKNTDRVIVFVAALVGALSDLVIGTRNNPITGNKSDFSKNLNKLHTDTFKHNSNGPIDYQGINFGGGYHRGLSKGHDILRFIEGISMFKNGQFSAIRYENGNAIHVMFNANQYGRPYEQMNIISAILEYSRHMFADFFSTNSLPFPGSSFLVEADNRQIRKFAADMYQNGFNLKNICIQSLSTVIVEIVIRVYFSIESVKQYKKELEINEDFSNFEIVKSVLKPINQNKLDEMLLVSHIIVTAVNIGKVVIKKSPWEINVTEILSVFKYATKVIRETVARNNVNSEYAKIMRNADEIHRRWNILYETLICDDREITETLNQLDTLIIA